VSASGVLA
jgi:hypothetical protein